MNRIVIVFFAVFNIAIVTYYFIHFYHIIKELREELGHEHEHKGGDHLVDGFRKLEKDEPIPRGMHVRINLQTGEREAKWLSGERYEKPGDDKDTSLIIASQDEDLKQSDLDTMKYQHLKEALKNIPSESTPETEEGDVKRKFRSYEELKKDMKDLKINVKTDSEVLHELMSKFQDIQSQKPVYLYEQIDMINMLKDLEYLLHQVDNAEEFAKENGISTIILPLLTSNSTILRTLSARVLGAAVQNNGKVQVAAFKTGVIPILLRNIAVEKDFEVRSGSIYALSCLVRSFPLAEMKMIDEGGLSVLISLFDETSDDILKLQLKVVAFFSDLIIEKEDAKFTMEEKEKMIQNVTDELPQKEYAQIVEKFKQYNRVELNSKLVEQGWCLKLAQLLVGKCAKKSIFEENNISKMNDEDVDHDVVDKVVSATIPIVKQCQQQFLGESKVQDFLTGLLKYYTKLANEENDDSFFHDLYNKVDSLCTILNLK